MREMRRVLKEGGKLILSVPHLSAIHEAPHDYYRYTRWGLESLSHGAGLRILETRSAGGLFAFLGHGASYVLLSTLGVVPGLGWLVRSLNLLVLVYGLGLVDAVVGMRSVYPCNLLLAAEAGDPAKGEQ